MCWNVWSILNEKKLRNFLQIIKDNETSIAVITETWFDSKNGTFSQIIKQCGYELHHAYREGKRGGGVAIMYKKQLLVKEGSASSSKFLSFEYACASFTLCSNKRLMLVCVYRNQEIAFASFEVEFGGLMDKLLNKGEMMLVVGDFNVWTDIEENSEAQKLTTMMSACGLSQIVSEPTHREGHTLDHVYVNEYELEIHHEVLSETMGLITDHLPIKITLPSPTIRNENNVITYRKLKDVDVEAFREDLKRAFEQLNFTNTCFKDSYIKFDEASRRIVEKHSPLLTRKVRSGDAAWIDGEYRKNRAKRRKLEKVWKKNKTEENLKEYLEQKRVCTELALSKQTHHYSQLINGASNSQQSLFKVANELLDKNSKKVLPTHEDPKKLANEFNNFFVEKIKLIRESIPEVKDIPSYYSRPFKGEKMREFLPTTEEEVKKLIEEHGIKTCAEDPIPSKLFKSALDVILPVLVQLINISLSEGSIDGVNWSVLDPLLKKVGLDCDVWKNYRPVNNLLYFSKITERIVSNRTDEHMNINNLHEASQFAYKKHHNTEIMLLGLTDEVLRGFDSNMATIVIFLDLSAAFDTIDIGKMLQILEQELGISETALKWFESFLTGRTQRVKIKGEYSESLDVPFGAPQGSVLGPKLFNGNVRSQPLVFNECKFNSSSFADDSNGRKRFALSFQFNVLKNEVPRCINEVVKWSFAHFMKINPDKTEMILFRPPSLNKEVVINGIFFEEQCIRFSNEVKNVGVWLDRNLSMEKHINLIVSHCYKILRDISRIKKYLDRKQIETLVHAVITSILDYCNCLFINISRDNLYKLQKVQNAAARLILGKRRRDSASRALEELHWLKIEARITYKILLLVYKVLRGQFYMKLNYKRFNGRPEEYLMLETPNFQTKFGKRLFEYNGSRLWNALPVRIRSEENIDVYKKSLKTLLFTDHEQLKRTAFKYQT